MKSDIWIPIYPGDYLADTHDLTAEEHGAYFLLMLAAWRNDGYLVADPQRLSRTAKLPYDRLNHILDRFWTATPDGKQLFQKRLMEEYKRAIERSEAAKEKAEKRWQRPDGNKTTPTEQPEPNAAAMPQHSPSNAQAMPAVMLGSCSSPSPSPSPLPIQSQNSSSGGNGGSKGDMNESLKLISETVQPELKPITFIEELQLSPAYKHLDVKWEFAKLEIWCKNSKKHPTKRRFINWLNRIDKPIEQPANQPAQQQSQPKAEKALTLWELKTILEAKSKQAEALKNKHSSQTAAGLEWNTVENRNIWLNLRKEIKSIESKIAGMPV